MSNYKNTGNYKNVANYKPAAGGAGTTTTALGSSGAIDISFTAKRVLDVTIDIITTTSNNPAIQFNGDTGANYQGMVGRDEVPDSTYSADDEMRLSSANETGNMSFKLHITNETAQEKKVTWIGTMDGSIILSGSGVWTNTAAQISSIKVLKRSGTGAIQDTSRITVYAHD